MSDNEAIAVIGSDSHIRLPDYGDLRIKLTCTGKRVAIGVICDRCHKFLPDTGHAHSCTAGVAVYVVVPVESETARLIEVLTK